MTNKYPMNSNLESQLSPFALQLEAETSANKFPTQSDAPLPLIEEPLIEKPLAGQSLSELANLSDSTRAVLAQLNNAVQTWNTSPEGQAELAAMSQMSLAEIKQKLLRLLISDALRPSVMQLAYHDWDFPLHSITVGIDFEICVIVGISGTLGLSFDPANTLRIFDVLEDEWDTLINGIENPDEARDDLLKIWSDFEFDASAFISGGLDLGVDAGALGGLQLGLWTNETDQISGWSIGGVIDGVDIGGGSFGVYFSYDHDHAIPIAFSGVTIAGEAGLEDGGEAQVSLTIKLIDIDIGLPPMYQPREDGDRLMELKTISRSSTSLVSTKDELYIKFYPDGGNTAYPHPSWDYISIDGDQGSEFNHWDCFRSIWFKNSVRIELWDADDVSDDDRIGYLDLTWDQISFLANTNAQAELHFYFEDTSEDKEYKATVRVLVP